MIPKAVIVAAGLSSRLHPLTAEIPKPLLPVGGEPMLVRSTRLLRSAGISEIAVVVGYRAALVREALRDGSVTIANPFHAQCNNMGSLWMARSFVGDSPFVYLHGDLVYSERLLAGAIAAAEDSAAIADLVTDFGSVDDEAMKVRTAEDGRLVESSKAIPAAEAAGEWTGIAVVLHPRLLFEEMERHLSEVALSDYDTAAFTTLAGRGHYLRCVPTNGEPWKEIDTLEDLESARALFPESV